MSLSESLTEAAIEYGPKLVKAAAKIVAGAIIGAITMALIKNRAWRKWVKEHDRETAKRMREEFDKKLKDIQKKYSDNEELLKRKIYDLCREFGLNPEEVC